MPVDALDTLESEARQYRRDIVSAVLRRTGDADLAEEVAQETLERVLVRLHGSGLQDPTKLENFMYRVAANVLREMRRKQSRYSTDNDEIDGAESQSESQFHYLARTEESRLLWQALERISNDGYREILIRFFLRQEDKDEICRTLNLGSRQFDNRIDRAKKALRRELGTQAARHDLRIVR